MTLNSGKPLGLDCGSDSTDNKAYQLVLVVSIAKTDAALFYECREKRLTFFFFPMSYFGYLLCAFSVLALPLSLPPVGSDEAPKPFVQSLARRLANNRCLPNGIPNVHEINLPAKTETHH